MTIADPCPSRWPGSPTCQHGYDPGLCPVVRYTPKQAAALGHAIKQHPDAKKLKPGQPVPDSLL